MAEPYQYARIRDENTGKARWFVYVESPHGGTIMACRFGQRRNAEKIAAMMNEAWQAEGRLYTRARADDPNPCIHTPSRCNGGGYDGCACGPYR
jgi:hypothetical protein